MAVREVCRQGPSDPQRKAWLRAGGSLTAHLRRYGEVRIVVLREGIQGLWLEERDDLRMAHGYVREVAILVDGIPAVWARSVTSMAAVRGAWRAMVSLGNRPLAELLFEDSAITRSPLRAHRIARQGPVASHIRHSLAGQPQMRSFAFVPDWARSSVFLHQRQALRVYEAFAPRFMERAQKTRCQP